MLHTFKKKNIMRKNIIALAILCICIASCLKTNILDSPGNKVNTRSYIEEYKEKPLFINVINNAENIELHIDTLRLCNVLTDIDKNHRATYILNSETMTIPYRDTLCCYPFETPVQRFNIWKPNKPHNSNITYFKIEGKLIMSDNLYEVYAGDMYVPLEDVNYFEYCTVINLVLDSKTPWYKYRGGKYVKILQTIDIGVSVDEWFD